ncbi:flagellar M-ring protein FliF [Pluralibacter gergoviae]|uniref:flagellar basal-body MS-ring/collar protein FliF n=1 Tax=Pluralibacter gergoviae TaxID=61647 RepID=UPI0005EC380D|nr:flagellar basal-body MS-ring/collar protein FliF [Pluralibacter gergoviae]KJM59205.1 flagellar MS-ring protein [Pluralibacter gergoviae]OUQ99700.1 flagellar M-ring protein FliF [Pluralibacter gergoviae]
MLNNIKQRIPSFALPASINKKPLLAGVGGAVLVLAIVLSLWNRSQGYVALYGAGEKLPTAQVVEVLGAENIAYRIDPGSGQILVTESKLPGARMALAARGISAAVPDGYELMDKEEMLGSSQFIQNVRYKRSLEGELAKSIMALDAVENARVHLGLSQSSSFVMTNRPESSASVMVQLRYGRSLDEQQVASIVQLVAGSVPGMTPASVRVVDQAGNLLSDELSAAGSTLAGRRAGGEIVQRIRDETRRNISELLLPLVGAGNFRVSVAPRVDLSSIEETQERLGKDPRVSDEQLSQENSTNELAIGIPGSLSNRPVTPPQGGGEQATAQNGSDPKSLSSRSSEQRKYTFDRDIRHIRHPGYRLEKMAVAVALNQQAPMLANIKPEQLAAIGRLVESAAGIDKARGDALTLDVLAFTPGNDSALPVVRWWQDPAIQYWGKTGGMGVLALLTLLFAVRPLTQRLSRPALPARSEAKEIEDRILGNSQSGPERALESGMTKSALSGDDSLPPLTSGLETKVEYLQVLAQNETERVAEVLKQWINTNERSNIKSEQ